jgi:hypothetical protein
MLLGDGLFGMFDEKLNPLLPHPVASYTEPAPLQKADKSHSWLTRWQYETIMQMGMGMLPDESNHGALTRNFRDTGKFEEGSLQEDIYNCPIAWSGQGFEGKLGEELCEIMRVNTLVSFTLIRIRIDLNAA